MFLPRKEWFSIKELAEEWDTSEDYIENYLLTKKLKSSIRLAPMELDYLDVNAGAYERKRSYGGIYEILHYDNLDWEINSNTQIMVAEMSSGLAHSDYDGKILVANNYTINKTDIIITLAEVQQFEEKYQKLYKAESLSQENVIPAYMDPSNPKFSPEIETAVSVWLAMYGQGEFNAKKGHKVQIENWITVNRKNTYKLTNEAIQRIATVANANKKGGAPKTDID